MNAFVLGAQLPSGPLFKAYEAWSKQYQKDVLVKVYQRSSIIDAEDLLREAIRQARTKAKESAVLIEVLLASERGSERDSNFTVNFILEKRADRVEKEILMRDDSRKSASPGLSAYDKGGKLYVKNKTKVHKGVMRGGVDVIIKTQKILSVEEANGIINEAFLQASVEHERNCKLIDFYVTKRPDRATFKVHLVMERMVRDMQKDIEKRVDRNQPYTEEELLQILQDVGAGLAHAETLKIAHRDIKPSNIFLGTDNRCKLGDFGSSWKKKFLAETHSGDGTIPYMSKEMQDCMSHPELKVNAFLADIYSLGLTVLHFALLRYPLDSEPVEECLMRKVQEMGHSEDFKQLIGNMVTGNVRMRLRLEQVIATTEQLLQRKRAASNPQQRRAMDEESKMSSPAVRQGAPLRQSHIQDESKPRFVRLTKIDLQFFVIGSTSWDAPLSFDRPIAYDEGSTYVFAGAERLCVCGNGSEETGNGGEAYVVHLSDMSVQELPNMGGRRWGAGLVVHNGDLLAFGGSTRLLICEIDRHQPKQNRGSETLHVIKVE